MMHGNSVYFSDQNLNPNSLVEGVNTHFQQLFKSFLQGFTRENTRVYHRLLEIQVRNRRHVLPIEVSDLRSYDENLYDRLMAFPLDMMLVMEHAVKSYLREKIQEYPLKSEEVWQVVLRSGDNPVRIRDIQSSMVSRMFTISGIIISATKPFIKASKLRLQCKKCLLVKDMDLQPGQWPTVPKYCEGLPGQTQKCPKDSFLAMPNSQVIDCQHLKIQQFPDQVPTGQVARTYSLFADRKNVAFCVPGDRVKITGVLLVNQAKGDHLTRGSIYVTGIQKIKDRVEVSYTESEEQLFKTMSKDPDLITKIYSSVAPGIYGNEEIKKAIACMLFGGSRKFLPDNTLLRGDVNVLLIGDPSTAKSQFLKFVEQTAAIAVYTSGKGSSAAGLTATITKDMSTGEFQIEGGALVLADGGIVCIDQFDKMKPADRVAIHEAMEQQTISVAKAGITTRLNSRTSILAAANPVFGKLDEFKTINEQIQLQTTILSRFDCIFIVRDINNPETNERIAGHILDIHQGKTTKMNQSAIPIEILKKYIKYAKNKIQPRLSQMASDNLINQYVADRQKAAQQSKMSKTSNSVPITVRQLEAVIRLSEALARMKLKSEVGLEEVEMAHYLFEISTIKTIQGSRQLGYNLSEKAAEQIQKVEQAIRRRVCIGNQVQIANLITQLQSKFNRTIVGHAVSSMVKNGEMRQIKQRKYLIRER